MLPSPVRSLVVSSYGRILRTLYAKHGLPWQVHDEVIRIDSDARHLVPHEPEPGLLDLLKATIRPGDVVLEVGAFVGIDAVLAASFAPDSHAVLGAGAPRVDRDLGARESGR